MLSCGELLLTRVQRLFCCPGTQAIPSFSFFLSAMESLTFCCSDADSHRALIPCASDYVRILESLAISVMTITFTLLGLAHGCMAEQPKELCGCLEDVPLSFLDKDI